MAITLKIEDRDRLPDGGPIEFRAGARSFEIGREQHLDWCLPDPDRIVSGHHCQVRYEDGAYWLNDISTNGTFVNGAAGRVKSPYRLANGDRLQIGGYHILVTIDGGEAPAAAAPPYPKERFVTPEDIWASPSTPPEPVDRRWFTDKQRQDHGVRAPDVLEQFIDLPTARPSARSPISEDFTPIPAAPLGNVPGSMISEHGDGMPALAIPQPTSPARPNLQALSADEFLKLVCEAAGLPAQAMSGRDSRDVARDIGLVLRTATEQMTILLQGRASAKRITKSANRTMIGSTNNNPMKFTRDAAEALEIMFQLSRAGYLDAPSSFREAFEDIQTHERATFAAMQKALSRLTEDLSPESVEDKVTGVAFASRKARAWEIYVQRWTAKTEHYENGILDVFFAYFSEVYDAMTKK